MYSVRTRSVIYFAVAIVSVSVMQSSIIEMAEAVPNFEYSMLAGFCSAAPTTNHSLSSHDDAP